MYQAFYRGSDYIGYPLLALGIFFSVFVVMVVRAFSSASARRYEGQAALPLQEDLHGER